MRKIRLLVSIVNYRSSALVIDLLPTLIQQLDSVIDHICIVDNDSGDDSVNALTQFIEKNNFSDSVTLIVSEKNGGFSFGNNLAIKESIKRFGSSPDFLLLLNPDTSLIKPAIAPLLEFAINHPKVGIVGSHLESEDGTAQCSAFRFPSIRSEFISSLGLGFLSQLFPTWSVSSIGIPEQEAQVDWVAGASMLIRYQVIEDIGLMDEQYFLYFEETDFCLQSKRKGWQCWYVPSSKVTHFVGQSTGVVSGDAQRRRRPRYWFESRQYYYRKNYGVIYTALADFVWGTGFAIWRLRRLIQRKPDTDPKYMLWDFWRNSIFFSWLRKD